MEVATGEHSEQQLIPAPHVHTPEQNRAASGVLAALIYSDLFDYPLTLDELVRYQVGSRDTLDEVARALSTAELLGDRVARTGPYYHLSGRQKVAAVRTERTRRSRPLWRRAYRYSRLIARMPFVRMVAVTGALSVHNIDEPPDIDLLVVARPGRVWLCRRFLIMCVRLARVFGDDLCPNYIVAESHLELDQRDFYTAHELAQMVPLHGAGTYKRMMRANRWASRYLPAAFGEFGMGDDPRRPDAPQRLMERVLSLRVFNRWEEWELRRLRAKLRPQIGSAAEVVCSPVQCKGHTGFHRRSVLSRFQRSADDLGVRDYMPEVVLADLNSVPAED